MKDNFSTQSDNYAKYRPSYPEELVNFILSHCEEKGVMWDAGTGSGQLASKLAGHFDEVFATDISYEQVKHAPQISNVTYHIQPAEETTFQNHQFDLVTVAQALHWFDLPKYFEEVHRTLKPGGIFAAVGYSLTKIEGLDELFYKFYEDKIGIYWDPERRIVEAEYRGIDFPFEDLGHHHFYYKHEWSFNDFIGYLNTWSAVKKYTAELDSNPVDEWKDQFKAAWGEGAKEVVTPVFLRLGRLK